MREKTLYSRRTYSRVKSVRLSVVYPGTPYQGEEWVPWYSSRKFFAENAFCRFASLTIFISLFGHG